MYQGVPEIVIETNSEMVQGSPDVDRTQNPTIIFPVQSAIAWENHRALGPPGATWGTDTMIFLKKHQFSENAIDYRY